MGIIQPLLWFCVLSAILMRFMCIRQSCWIYKKAPHWVRVNTIKKNTLPKLDIFRVVLCTWCPSSHALRLPKMRKLMGDKVVQVTRCRCPSVTVVVGLVVTLFCFISQCSSKPLRLPSSPSWPLLHYLSYYPYALYARTSHILSVNSTSQTYYSF